MAAIKNLVILNPADKTRFYSVASGEGAPADVTDEGAPADVTDELIVNVKDFPIGSQYTDVSGKKFYVRMAEDKAVADWVAVNAGA